ncbi:MAG: aminopeptidase [Nitrospiraceae bacterium]|nr:aminopeptidase [Nitrospiraceae bacterium]|tara:strand:+ start:1470 stop:2537 length:1068 start_codon:yes stop_codon:yes gene_type:complete
MRNATRYSCLASLLLALSITGCSTLEYYIQAVAGHLDIISHRKPIAMLIEQPETPKNLKQKLSRVLQIRKFATQELGLPDNGSYTGYTDVDRPYVVWNVVATPELSMIPKTWCFPIAGCVSYRGYFSHEKAKLFAHTLRQRGYDVAITGVRAYSTLGWFKDPILNTVIHYSDPELASLIFHELSHQMIYISDDSIFNESFATVVEQEGTRRWLENTGHPDAIIPYQTKKRRQQTFISLIMNYRDLLSEIFGANQPDDWKRAQKQILFGHFKKEYKKLKHQWNGDSTYDAWMSRNLNNAHFASTGTYYHYVPVFQTLLADHQYDLSAFYEAVRVLGHKPKTERDKLLEYPAKYDAS